VLETLKIGLFVVFCDCRDVVIALLRAKGATTGLKRLDIVEASKIALKSEVQANIYQKVKCFLFLFY
jgi:hypothetical protein